MTCGPASGTTFPLGVSTVNCSAADAAGNSATGSFTVTVHDTIAPQLTLPANITEQAASAAGSQVSFTASATDTVSGPRVVTCVPASGGTFPIGVTTVDCSAADAAGNSAAGSFTVTVQDTTAPELALPANITAQAASAAGSQVSFTASATDAISGARVVTCAPASGATFPLGVTTVNCSAADAAGNPATGSFTVTVHDTLAPQLTLPANIIEEAGSAGGVLVNFTASATDAVSGSRVVTCAPASGATFPIGVTTVHCSAADAAGNAATGSFTVTVHDAVAPQLTLPANITGPASWPTGLLVNFEASATDAVSGSRVVTCVPASGSMFPIGVTTVNCSATDAAGNSATGSFTVTVQDTIAPQLTLPANITEPASSPAGQVVNFTASATDAISGPRVVTCLPASGATFPLGVTTVNCSAADAAGNSATGSFTVTVQDTIAPQLTLPANITEQATSAAGLRLTFATSATDAVSGSRAVTCVPASGSTFPIGVTTVRCSTADAAGNSAAGLFTVTITPVVPGKMHGTGVAAGASFTFQVQESANYVQRGWLILKLGSNWFAGAVTRASFSNSAGFAPGRTPLSGVDTVTFEGAGLWNGHFGYTYEVTATDQGEPGNHDTFKLVVRTPNGTVVATTSGTLTSGNNQSLK